MRVHDLRAVVEVGLEAIIMSGVMRCGDDDSRICPQFADGEGELRSGTRAVEEVGIAAEVGAGFCTKFCEVSGEMACVVGKNENGFPVRTGKLFCVCDQPSNGATEIIKIHRCRAHTRVLRSAIWSADSLFGQRHHLADGPSS